MNKIQIDENSNINKQKIYSTSSSFCSWVYNGRVRTKNIFGFMLWKKIYSQTKRKVALNIILL